MGCYMQRLAVLHVPAKLQATSTSLQPTPQHGSPLTFLNLWLLAPLQVCCDLGYSRVYVYRQGMYGWRLDQSVLPYPAYSLVSGYDLLNTCPVCSTSHPGPFHSVTVTGY
jgi:hypothetical protein